MKRILYSILALALCYFCLDRALASLLAIIYQKSHYSEDIRIKEVANETDADFIMMGASRTCRHYVPSIIEDSLHVKAFNAGVDGSGDIFFQYALLNLLLEHHTPKVICMEIGSPLFDGTARNIAQLAPYIGHNAEVDKVFQSLNLYNGYSISHTYRYNTCILSNLMGLIQPAPDSSLKGYDPLPRPTKPQVQVAKGIDSTDIRNGYLHYNKLAMSYMEKYVELCDSMGIKLILCAPPSCSVIEANVYKLADYIATKYNLLLLDYHTSGFLQDDVLLWRDFLHLCGDGAELFSSQFCKDVNHWLTLDRERGERNE